MALISEKYNLIIKNQAQLDIYSYIVTIHSQYDSPKTAKKHYDALYERFEQIKKYPTLYPIHKERALVIMYGPNVRRMNYKKMAIIYTINQDTIFIHRVIASKMIIGM